MALKNISPRTLQGIKTGVFLLALLPTVRLGMGTLGANPIEKITHNTGYWTLVLLLITLTITPVRRILGWLWLMRLRRMLGLFAFFYGCLHLLTYMLLDQFFDWQAIAEDVIKRPYIIVGCSAFLMLIPLAVTSTDNMIRKLGGKLWLKLHRLIYISTLAGVVHFCWLVKKDLTTPLLLATWLAVLLMVRVVFRIKNSL